LVYPPLAVLTKAMVSGNLERRLVEGGTSLALWTRQFCFREFSRGRISFHDLFLTCNALDLHAIVGSL